MRNTFVVYETDSLYRVQAIIWKPINLWNNVRNSVVAAAGTEQLI